MTYKTYITFSSWEERFIKTFKNDIEKNSFEKIIILDYKNGHNFEHKNKFIEEIKLEDNDKIRFIDLEINNDKNNWTTLNEKFNTNLIDDEVLINISTMPRNMIFYTLHFLDKLQYKYKTIYYTVKNHHANLTQSPLTPRLILQHSGEFETNKKILLVIALGYDDKRLYQLYHYFEPIKTIILSEKNHISEIEKEINFDFNEIEKEEYQIDSFSENNIFNLLEEKITPLQNKYNIILCSLGAKLSAVELYKYNKKYSKVALAYVPSKDYHLNYSDGVDLGTFLIR